MKIFSPENRLLVILSNVMKKVRWRTLLAKLITIVDGHKLETVGGNTMSTKTEISDQFVLWNKALQT